MLAALARSRPSCTPPAGLLPAWSGPGGSSLAFTFVPAAVVSTVTVWTWAGAGAMSAGCGTAGVQSSPRIGQRGQAWHGIGCLVPAPWPAGPYACLNLSKLENISPTPPPPPQPRKEDDLRMREVEEAISRSRELLEQKLQQLPLLSQDPRPVG